MQSSQETSYICRMKNLLYIIGFIAATFSFCWDRGETASFPASEPGSGTVMEETSQKNREQYLVILSEDLKNGSLDAPRRIAQSSPTHFSLRTATQSDRQIQYFKSKGCGVLAKLSEGKAIAHYTNYTAIWRDKGLHVFALRKLLI